VELLKGEALVEATDLQKGNNIQIVDHGTTTTLDKNGLYRFDANQPEVAVYEGKASLQEADGQVDLKKGHETAPGNLKSVKFDTKQGDDLYNWSSLRSQYLSEASISSARTYLVGSPGWYGGGWYWNPWYGYYSYLPGDGFLYSPFGWGFYSPLGVGYYRGSYGYGYLGPRAGLVWHGPMVNRGFAASPRSSFGSGGSGFRGGSRR
jgi:hypothetical protein